MGKMSTKFDFLSNLYKENPQAFAEYHREVLEEFFNSLPEERQVKARQLQWKLDNELRKYKDPVARMNRMVEIFWEGVDNFRDVLNATTNNE